MESQEQRAADSPNAGDEPNPATQSIDVAEVARADVRPSGAAASKHPPQIPLAPMKRMQARFNPLADGLMYLVVFVGGFVGVGFRRATDLLLPSVNGTPFVVGTFVSNMLACFLFAMLTEYMATASWLRRRVRQVVSRGVGLGFARRTVDDVRRDVGNHGRHARAAFRQRARLSCGKFRWRFDRGRGWRGADAGVAGARHTQAGSGCVFRCFHRVRFCQSDTRAYAIESGRRGAFCRAGRNGVLRKPRRQPLRRRPSRLPRRDRFRESKRQPCRRPPASRADRPRSADSSAGRSSAAAVIAAVVARRRILQAGQLAQPIQQSNQSSSPSSSRSQSAAGRTFCPASSPNRSLRRFRLSPTRLPGRCADDVDDLSVRRSGSHGPLRARRVNSTRLEPRESKNESQLPAIIISRRCSSETPPIRPSRCWPAC